MKHTYNPETGLPEPVDHPYHGYERVGTRLIAIGTILIVLCATVTFDPINISRFRFIYKWFGGEANNVRIYINPGPLTGSLGLFLLLLGIYLSRSDIAHKAPHLKGLIIAGVVMACIVWLASWKKAPKPLECEDLLQNGKVEQVEAELERLFEKTNDLEYQDCARKYAQYRLEQLEKALKHDETHEAKELLKKLKNTLPGIGEWPEVRRRLEQIEETLSYREQLSLSDKILAKSYKIPTEHQLMGFLEKYASGGRVQTEGTFKVQDNEVTVGAFRKYAEETNSDIGDWWYKERKRGTLHSDERPVDNISWLEAKNYADWLSRKTGWELRLPTIQQWVAACIEYAKDDLPITGAGKIEEKIFPNKVNHLLGNLREWSAESDGCNSPKKKRLLGENRFVDAYDVGVIGKQNCADKDSAWTGVGFRLVRIMP